MFPNPNVCPCASRSFFLGPQEGSSSIMKSPFRKVVLSHTNSLKMRYVHTFTQIACLSEAQINPFMVLDGMNLNSRATGSEPRHHSHIRGARTCMVLPFEEAPLIPLYCCYKSLGRRSLLARIVCNIIRSPGTSCSRGIRTYRFMA